jgi:phospholipase A-2-activating protein
LGDVKKSDLPGTEALSQPGKKGGQVIMVKNGNLVEAHQVSGKIIVLLVLTLTLVG